MKKIMNINKSTENRRSFLSKAAGLSCLFLLCWVVSGHGLKIPASLYYSFEKGTREVMNVYVKIEGRDNFYARFRIQHEIIDAQNRNLWRIVDSYFARLEQGQMVDEQRILTNGENEFVWYSAREGVTDATGGYHGNERIDIAPGCGIQFFVDGLPIDHSQAIPLTRCLTFHYEQHATMHQTGVGALNGQPGYQPVPGLPVECKHFKKTTFSNGGYTTVNRLEWGANNARVKNCIYALFCVDNRLTTHAQNESGQSVALVMDGGNKIASTGKHIVYANVETGLKIECRGVKVVLPEHTLNTYIWDNQNYHKFYSIASFGTALPVEGDILETESSISFSY